MTTENRFVALRQKGRTLEGTAIRYGDEAVLPWGREKFEAGAFGMVETLDVILNSQHDRQTPLARTGGAGLFLADSPEALTITANLPNTSPADDCLELVKRGVLRGLSIEFSATAERQENDLRIVERADLVGCAVVDKPAYPGADVSARARKRSGRTVRAEIPIGKPLSCECAGGGCSKVEILSEAIDKVFSPELFEQSSKQIIAAYFENYSGPLASTSRGTLRGKIKGTGFQDRRPVIDVDIPDSEVGRALIDAWESSGIIARPFLADIQGEIVDGVQKISDARLRAIILSSTDAREGWPEPQIIETPKSKTPRAQPRRLPVWL